MAPQTGGLKNILGLGSTREPSQKNFLSVLSPNSFVFLIFLFNFAQKVSKWLFLADVGWQNFSAGYFAPLQKLYKPPKRCPPAAGGGVRQRGEVVFGTLGHAAFGSVDGIAAGVSSRGPFQKK